MIWYLLILWILVYISLIFKNFLDVRKLNHLLTIMTEYLNSATITKNYPINLIKKENYNTCLNELLFYFPAISKYKSLYSVSLQYGYSDIENYTNTCKLYNELLMKRNFLMNDFFQSLNPIYSLKYLFCIPSTFIKWLGFCPRNTISKMLNLICWIATWFLNTYSNEIKSLLDALF